MPHGAAPGVLVRRCDAGARWARIVARTKLALLDTRPLPAAARRWWSGFDRFDMLVGRAVPALAAGAASNG